MKWVSIIAVCLFPHSLKSVITFKKARLLVWAFGVYSLTMKEIPFSLEPKQHGPW